MTEERLTIKIDAETKRQLKVFAERLGLTSSRLVRVLIKQALREKRVLLLNKDPLEEVEKLIAQNPPSEDLD